MLTPVMVDEPLKSQFLPADELTALDMIETDKVVMPLAATNPADVDVSEVPTPLTRNCMPVIVPETYTLTAPVSVEAPIIEITALVEATSCPILVPVEADRVDAPLMSSNSPVTEAAWYTFLYPLDEVVMDEETREITGLTSAVSV